LKEVTVIGGLETPPDRTDGSRQIHQISREVIRNNFPEAQQNPIIYYLCANKPLVKKIFLDYTFILARLIADGSTP